MEAKDRLASIEKGEAKSRKREISISSGKVPKGVLGVLLGRWALSGSAEEMEVTGVPKHERAHAE